MLPVGFTTLPGIRRQRQILMMTRAVKEYCVGKPPVPFQMAAAEDAREVGVCVS